MNYPTVSIDSAAEELNRLHAGIADKLRSTVEDAIRAGEILSQVKARVGHGNFLPWIKGNCKFSERSARNYMSLYEYREKTATVADLTSAYALIEDLEAREKRPRLAPPEPPREEFRPARAPDPVYEMPLEDGPTGKPEAAPEPEVEHATDIDGAVSEITIAVQLLMAGLADDVARHAFVNGLIKRLRALSIQFNQEA